MSFLGAQPEPMQHLPSLNSGRSCQEQFFRSLKGFFLPQCPLSTSNTALLLWNLILSAEFLYPALGRLGKSYTVSRKVPQPHAGLKSLPSRSFWPCSHPLVKF